MASFSPVTHHFNYKKLFPDLNPTTRQIVYENDSFAGFFSSNHQVVGLPNWLEAINLYYNSSDEEFNFTLRLKTGVAEGLAAGDYTAQIRVRWTRNTGFGFVTVYSSYYTVTLDVDDTVQLTANPNVLSFGTHIIGESAPQNQVVSIQAENTWNLVANQSWVTLSATSGLQNGLVTVGVDVAGLGTGQYQAILTLTDGFFPAVYITVSLNVTEGDTESTFIYVSPRNLQFVSELGVENTTQKTLSLEASHAWTASSNQSWLTLTATSGSSGVQTLTIGVDSIALTNTETTYLATITFESQDIQKTVFVELFLVEFLVSGILSDTLYFSDDYNKLLVTNIADNMFLYLEAIAANGEQNIAYFKEAPYLNGLAKVVLGLEANNLLKHREAPSPLSSGVRNNIFPLNVDFSAFNKNKFNNTSSLIKTFQNVKFLTGKTPETPNKLCYTPDKVFMSKNGVLSLSALAATTLETVSTTTYNENLQEAGGEWDSSQTASVELESTEFASDGTKSIKFPAGTIGQSVYLNKSTPLTLFNGFIKLKLKIAAIGNYGFQIRLSNTVTSEDFPVIYCSGSNHGINPNTTDWQEVVIPIPDISALDQIRLINTSNTEVIYLDEIELLSSEPQLVMEDTDITITGDYTGTISTSIASNLYVYNALINLEPLGLSAGNKITVSFAGISTEVYIVETPPQQTLIAFENEWREFEIFECRGFLTKETEAAQVLETNKEDTTEHKTIVDIETEKTFTLNTGWIYTQQEVDWLAKLLEAKRVFIYENGTPLEIVTTTKKLETYKTREFLKSFNLKFDVAKK